MTFIFTLFIIFKIIFFYFHLSYFSHLNQTHVKMIIQRKKTKKKEEKKVGETKS